MKNFIFLFYMYSLLVIWFIIHIESRKKKGENNNRLSAFPNPWEAPTSVEQLNLPKPGPPLFSDALNELDPSKGITKEQFMNTVQFSLYKLDRSQTELIFDFINRNHNDIIERKEWEDFVGLYILPYEACLEWKSKENKKNNSKSNSDNKNNGNLFLLNKEQLKTCFEADPKTKEILFREIDEKRDPYEIMYNIISLKSKPGLNFYHYLFLRKVIFAWFQCNSSISYLSKNDFNCAISHIIPAKYLPNLEKEQIYDVGLRFQFNDNSLIQLDFISFLRIGHYANIFFNFNKKNDSSILYKDDFLKSIMEDREANQISQENVKNFYTITNTDPHKNPSKINFETFCFFFHFHKLFDRYSKERPLQISKKEFLELLEDDETPIKIVMAIDTSFTNFEEKDYQEGSLILQKYRTPRENMFFYSFRAKMKSHRLHSKGTIKNKNEKNNSKGSYYDHTSIKNENNREIFFSIFTNGDSNYLIRSEYLRAFQLANLFVEIGEKVQLEFNHDLKPFYSSIKLENIIHKIEATFETANPPISLPQRKLSGYFQHLPNNISLDLLTFLSLMNFENKIPTMTGSNQNESITETDLKKILQSFGMRNMPDTVLDLSYDRRDQLNRRLFKISDIIKNVIIAQSTVSEQMREKFQIKNYDLKLNKEVSRKFPDNNRRAKSSPLV
jgi:hypothetical protein